MSNNKDHLVGQLTSYLPNFVISDSYFGFCDDHLFQHPGNREKEYSNLLVPLTHFEASLTILPWLY